MAFKVEDFWVNSVEGVRISGMVGSVETVTKGRLLTIAVTSAMKVERTLCVRCLGPSSASIEFKTFLTFPIILSHTPPIWEPWGGLKTHSHRSLPRQVSTVCLSISLNAASNSLHAPMKLVPLSERSCAAGPLTAKNLRRAFMKLEVSMDSINSIWIARMVRHIKTTTQRLL